MHKKLHEYSCKSIVIIITSHKLIASQRAKQPDWEMATNFSQLSCRTNYAYISQLLAFQFHMFEKGLMLY